MVTTGDVAVVHYVGRIASGDDAGEVFDTSDVDVALEADVYQPHRDYKPLTFEVGSGEALPAVDEAVRSMEPGETRTITVDPEDGFGDRREDRVLELSREELESRSGREARAWRLVGSETGDVGWITDVSDESVTVDFNHDLAGHRLTFEVRLIEVREGDVDERASH